MILAAQFFIDEAWVRGCGGNSGESRRRREKSVSKVSKWSNFILSPMKGISQPPAPTNAHLKATT
jgi:hypothetical protein